MEASLFGALLNNNIGEVRRLVEGGVSVNTSLNDEHGASALHIAAGEGHLEIVKYLVEHGAIVHIEDKFGETPLHYAAGGDHLKTVKYLVENGASIEAKGAEEENTPLHLAAAMGYLQIVKYLVENGANLHAKNAIGNTVIESALSGTQNHDVVKYLLQKGGVLDRDVIEHARRGGFKKKINRLILQAAEEKQGMRSRITRRALQGMNRLPPELTEYIANIAEGPVRNIGRRPLRRVPAALQGYTARERNITRRRERATEARERGRMAMENR